MEVDEMALQFSKPSQDVTMDSPKPESEEKPIQTTIGSLNLLIAGGHINGY